MSKAEGTKPTKLGGDLRTRAEAEAAGASISGENGDAALLHELRVHRIELEMQNEELRAAIVQLEDAEARFKSLFEAAPIGYLCVDSQWAIREANRVLGDMLHFDRDAIVGRPISRFVLPNDQDALHLHCRSLAKGHSRQTAELRLRTSSGGYLSVRMDTVKVEDACNGISYHVAITDMTEQHAATDALRDSEQWHRTVLEAALDGFLQADRKGRLVNVNHALLRMAGYSRQELLAMRYADLWADDCAEACAATMHRVMHGAGERFEAQCKHKDGSLVDVEVSLQYEAEGGGRLVGFIRDVTARKRLEAQRSDSQRLESIGRLAGGVAHDFNNMLGVILGGLELALERLPADETIVGDLLQAQQAARHSATLTRDLLAFARQQSVEPRLTDLNAIVAGMADMLRSTIGEEIALGIDVAPDPWPVSIDPTQVSQMLMNLCINSRDAIEGTGAIRIKTDNVILSEEDCAGMPGHEPGEHAALTVSDTGCGMPPVTLARIFEPFFTTKAIGKGTGLGLAQVYGVATQAGGLVRAESTVGQGTVVQVFLPRAAVQTVPSTPPKPSERPHGNGETVLLVEDEKGLLVTCRRFLTPLGYNVLSAASPGEALALSDEYSGAIDLLLTDVVMPELDGAELADRLVAARPGLKRLFMSGYTAEALGSRLLRDNATLLPKPFTRDELACAVRDALAAPAPGAGAT